MLAQIGLVVNFSNRHMLARLGQHSGLYAQLHFEDGQPAAINRSATAEPRPGDLPTAADVERRSRPTRPGRCTGSQAAADSLHHQVEIDGVTMGRGFCCAVGLLNRRAARPSRLCHRQQPADRLSYP